MKKAGRFLSAALVCAAVIGMITASQPVAVSADTTQPGTLSMDTVSYNMAPGTIYDFRAEVKGGDLKQSEVTVSDSRNGSVVKLSDLGNGKYRVTAVKAGATYITAWCRGVHASIQVNVIDNLKVNYGQSARSVSIVGPVSGQGGSIVFTTADPATQEDSFMSTLGVLPAQDAVPYLEGRAFYAHMSALNANIGGRAIYIDGNLWITGYEDSVSQAYVKLIQEDDSFGLRISAWRSDKTKEISKSNISIMNATLESMCYLADSREIGKALWLLCDATYTGDVTETTDLTAYGFTRTEEYPGGKGYLTYQDGTQIRYYTDRIGSQTATTYLF